MEATGKYVCSICGYVYNPEIGDKEHGIPAGTPFEELPDDQKCARCRPDKDKFNKAQIFVAPLWSILFFIMNIFFKGYSLGELL